MPEKSKEIPYITRDVPEEPYEVFKDPKIIQHIHASMIQAGIPKEQVFVASYRSGTISISLKGLGQISFDLNTHYIKSGGGIQFTPVGIERIKLEYKKNKLISDSLPRKTAQLELDKLSQEILTTA